jgi:biopolymer transport protein ExbD
VTIRFPCAACQRVLKAEERLAGTSLCCPACGAQITVPRVGPSGGLSQSSFDRAPTEGWSGTVPLKGAEESREEVPAVSFQRTGEAGDEIDMTPMIDCVFLLLIFFLITASFALQKSIEVPPPEQREKTAKARTIEQIESDADYIVVRIERDDTILVDGAEALSEQDLLVKLRDARETPRQSDAARPTNRLVLADGECRHETVVMALDAGSAVGMENLRLATVDDEEY